MSSPTGPRVGIAPDSWGVWNAVDAAQPGPDQYLREVQQAGFHFTEIGPYGYLSTDAAELQSRLDEHELIVSAGTVFTGLHRGAEELDSSWSEISKVAGLVKAVGGDHLIVIPEMWQRALDGEVSSPRQFTDEEWANLCSTHNKLGKRLMDEFGLKQQFHSHAESPVGSEIEVVRLLEGTDENYMNLCLDTGHYAYYFGNSVDLIEKYPSRIGYLHLKQVDPVMLAHALKNDISFVEAVQLGVMVEPPQGVPPYDPILEAAQRVNPGIFAIIEQDMYPVGDFAKPLQIAKRTYEYIANCGVPVQFQ
jgi:inosose dehydratase